MNSFLKVAVSVLLIFPLSCFADTANLWTNCVLYNQSHPDGPRLFMEASSEPNAVIVEDMSIFWPRRLIDDHAKIGNHFLGVCRYVEDYKLPTDYHCVFRNPDYRFDRDLQTWVLDVGWNPQGTGESQCWYEAGWTGRSGYWGLSGTLEAGEWIEYEHPCKDLVERMTAGEAVIREESCDAYYWGAE